MTRKMFGVREAVTKAMHDKKARAHNKQENLLPNLDLPPLTHRCKERRRHMISCSW